MEFILSECGKNHLCLMVIDAVKKANLTTVSFTDNVHLEIAEQWVIWTNSKISPSKIQAKKFANQAREKAANTGKALRQIVFYAQIDLPLHAASTIPSYSTYLRSINRLRQQALKTMPKPEYLESRRNF